MPTVGSSQSKATIPRSPPRKRPAAAETLRESADFAVVGIGASAGGLEACTKLVSALPARNGMAFILVQHLDPTHESMMVGLLAEHTPMPVLQATDGMPLAPGHLYVIAPGTYLSVADGALQVRRPQAPHGARLPFDFLLHSLAQAFGPRAVCVVLSGTGADGSRGLRTVKENGGLVLVQDPEEAGYDGMPRSAIQTGAVDRILRAADIPEALAAYTRHRARARPQTQAARPDGPADSLTAVIELLRTKTIHDFSLYKRGTLQRRVERRMAMAGFETGDMARYLALLRTDRHELDRLATDLLINVTSFFRDRKVFDILAEKIVPELVRNHPSDQPLRIWVPGCSTGEETYSLTMLFREQMEAAKSGARLQVFASDVDPDAVTGAREGHYPATIEADVSPARLARFFAREDHGYRVLPELREAVIFTVQDVLADAPFSRLDLVSCRNLLIYLRPEAQAKVISLLHFALRQHGILVLGSAETAGNVEGRFEVVSKSARIYRCIGRARIGELAQPAGDGPRGRAPAGRGPAAARQSDLGDLGRRVLLESYAPAAVLINHRHECLFMFGRTDRYVRVAPGRPTFDLLVMARPGMRSRLRGAIQRAIQEQSRIVVAGGRMIDNEHALSFNIDVQPVLTAGEPLLLVCFVDLPEHAPPQHGRDKRPVAPRIAELERELAATRTELEGAIHDLELSSEEQKAVNEEALSVNEEFQSTNEELLTSKEELQALNEELTALNSQLQETLERQRTTSNDLQNVLYSTDVATLFLDKNLNIRFFTPATKSVFAVIPSDIGRPLADLSSLAADETLLDDARAVLRTPAPREREITAQSGSWYARRILPYRTQDNGVEGVVITFADITERRHAADALEAASHQAERATAAKSRFLAAASHDLRQPLQTMSLITGILAKKIRGKKYDEALQLVTRLEGTAGSMSGILNALLDINQIEAGMVRPAMIDFPVAGLLGRLGEEFSYQAQAHGLALRVVPCRLSIHSDPDLLEQILRNLLSNALKYTKHGKVLLGCRRVGGTLRIEVWDTGLGIPADELQAIFDEYHQLDNAARERSKGLGLGLSIVQRLAELLGHRVSVRSKLRQGSVFAIEIGLSSGETEPPRADPARGADDGTVEGMRGAGAILVVEDDPEVRDLLELVLREQGHHVTTAPDAIEALKMADDGAACPDLVIADYNLPNAISGLQLTERLRTLYHRDIPAIILTGDISTDTLRAIALARCVHISKPVQTDSLMHAIRRLLPRSLAAPHAAAPQAAEATAAPAGTPVIFIVDDDSEVREFIRRLLEADGVVVKDYPTAEAFLTAYHPGQEACLLVDANLPGMSGLDLLQRLRDADRRLPAIMITGNSDVHMAVQAMKAGASDFLEKPIGEGELRACVERALDQVQDSRKLTAWRASAADHVARLTPRQRQIMALVLTGQPSKNIAADLGISQRTVENHRAAIMAKTGTKSLPALARLALAANSGNDDPPSP